MVNDRKIWEEFIKGKESIGKNECPFCKDDEYLMKKFDFWIILKNKYPYNQNKRHILLIPIRHIEHTKKLNKEELLELPKIEKYIEDYYKGENYFSFIRHTNGGKSIKHIHYHYIPGTLYSNKLEEALK